MINSFLINILCFMVDMKSRFASKRWILSLKCPDVKRKKEEIELQFTDGRSERFIHILWHCSFIQYSMSSNSKDHKKPSKTQMKQKDKNFSTNPRPHTSLLISSANDGFAASHCMGIDPPAAKSCCSNYSQVNEIGNKLWDREAYQNSVEKN